AILFLMFKKSKGQTNPVTILGKVVTEPNYRVISKGLGFCSFLVENPLGLSKPVAGKVMGSKIKVIVLDKKDNPIGKGIFENLKKDDEIFIQGAFQRD